MFKKILVMAIVSAFAPVAMACMPTVQKETNYRIVRPTEAPLVVRVDANETATFSWNRAPMNAGPQATDLEIHDSDGVVSRIHSENSNVLKFRLKKSGEATLVFVTKNLNQRVVHRLEKPLVVEFAPKFRGCR